MSFKHFSQFLNSFGRSFLIGDDFNAKHSQWSCQTKNTRARMLQNITYNTRIKFISPPGPTYWPSRLNRHPDILDYFLTTILRHNPFHKKSSRSSMLPQSSSSQSELWNFCNPARPSLVKGPINWCFFSKNLKNATNQKISLKTTDQIDETAHNLTTSIQIVIYKSSYVTSTPNNLKYNILSPIKSKNY